jgi:hypothetical protein
MEASMNYYDFLATGDQSHQRGLAKIYHGNILFKLNLLSGY